MSDIRKLYMAGACGIITGLIIYFLPPIFWWAELLMLTTLWLGLWWAFSFVLKKRSLSLWVSVLIITLLVLRRFDLLSWVTFGVWLIALGLISIRE